MIYLETGKVLIGSAINRTPKKGKHSLSPAYIKSFTTYVKQQISNNPIIEVEEILMDKVVDADIKHSHDTKLTPTKVETKK